jgi:hypothetical protein
MPYQMAKQMGLSRRIFWLQCRHAVLFSKRDAARLLRKRSLATWLAFAQPAQRVERGSAGRCLQSAQVLVIVGMMDLWAATGFDYRLALRFAVAESPSMPVANQPLGIRAATC